MSTSAVGELLAALAVIVTLARLAGVLARRLGQPAVIGELAVGVVLGPTFFGAGLANHLFPPAQVRPALSGIGDLGLVLFMFIVGYELDRAMVTASGRMTLTVAVGSILVPLGLGVGLGWYLAGQQHAAHAVPFALFIGVATAITAFPVLARILADRGMARTRIGSIALAAASVNDVSAWILLVIVVIAARSGAAGQWRIALLPAYVLVMAGAVRPLVNWLARLRVRAGRLTPDVLAVILAALIASAYATEWMGLNFIFGSFAFGVLMPREGVGQLRAEILERLEHIAALVLLPVYFVLAGLSVNLAGFGARDGLDLALILIVAMAGKFGGTYLAARARRMPARQAGALATLMNSRGLTEIVILATGLQLGIIGTRLYSLMVIMAVVTTAMAGPILGRVYPPRLVRRDIAEADRRALGQAADQVIAATGEAATDDAVLTAGTALAAGRPGAQLVISALLPYRAARLEVGTGLSGELLEMTGELARLDSAAQAAKVRGAAVSVLARFTATPAADLSGLAAAAGTLVIAAGHPDYQDVTAAAEVPVTVTVTRPFPASWQDVAARAGTGNDASAAAAVAGLLAGHGPAAPGRLLVDPAGVSGRALDRFSAAAGPRAEICGQLPAGALVVAAAGSGHPDAHLLVAAGPDYAPAEPPRPAAAQAGAPQVTS